MAEQVVGIKITASGVNAVAHDIDSLGKSSENASSKISKLSSGLLGIGAKAAKGLAVGAVAGFTAALGGAVVATKKAVTAWADLEQSLGGVETLFKGASKAVIDNANAAYKTVGMSANAYMENATSFAASMVSSLGGNVNKAAAQTDVAMRDIADNANKMGTDMESLTATYQSLARGNAGMLDNLKLGYGGTLSELARLVNESGVMGDTMVTATTVSSIGFAKVTEAIHATQQRLGITGTTAKEAASTITGSFNATKAAVENFWGALANPDADLDAVILSIGESFGNLATNVSATVSRIAVSFSNLANSPAKLEGLTTVFETVGPQLVQSFGLIVSSLGKIAAQIIPGMAQAIASNVPILISTIGEVVTGVLPALSTAVVGILPAALEAVTSLITGLVEVLPQVIQPIANAIPDIVQSLATAITTLLPVLVDGISNLITDIATTSAEMLPTLIPVLITGVADIINAIVIALPTFINALTEGTKIMMQGMADAMPAMTPVILDALVSVVNTLIKTLPELLPAILDASLVMFDGIVKALIILTPVLIEAGKYLINKLEKYLPALKPELLPAALKLFNAIVDAMGSIIAPMLTKIGGIINRAATSLLGGIPRMINSGMRFFMGIFGNIGSVIAKAPQKVAEIVTGITSAVSRNVSKMVSAGYNLLTGLWNGIKNAKQWVINKIGGVVNDIVGAAKNFLGIHSPSKLFADEIGRYIPAGIAVGVTANADDALQSVRSLSSQIGAQSKISLASQMPRQAKPFTPVLPTRPNSYETHNDNKTYTINMSINPESMSGIKTLEAFLSNVDRWGVQMGRAF